MFNYNGDPVYFTKPQVNKLLHSFINCDWWKYNSTYRDQLNIPYRRFQLEEFHVEQVHNVAKKVADKYSRSCYIGEQSYVWKKVVNEYNDYKSGLLSWIYRSSVFDYNPHKCYTKDYIEMLRAAF
jgi:hypothetical protein